MRRTSVTRILSGFSAALLALAPLTLSAAPAGVQNRIRTNITNGTRAEVFGTVHPRVQTAADLGPAAEDKKLTGMSLRFAMSDAQSSALDQLLADQQNPASPRFHQWLTPDQFAAQFGLSQADLAKVTAWLTAQGFTVTGTSNGGTFVTFDGTVAQVNAAFGTSIHNVLSNGETHFANVADITVPAALNGVVGAVTGLHDFHPHPHLSTIARPQFTSSQTGNHYVAPGDLYAIYDMMPLQNAGYTGAGIGTGANCHSVPSGTACGDIAVVGQVELAGITVISGVPQGTPTDVVAFRQAAGLNTSNLPKTVNEGGDPGPAQSCSGCSPNSSDLSESSLDVEWSGAMAPGASILFVNGPDVIANSLTQAIDQNLAPILTMSYGNCEAAWGSANLNAYNQLFRQAAAQGQTIISSSGDNGATDCDQGAFAIEGLAVDFPSSSPYVLSMGGTMFNGDAAASASGTNWSATSYWAGTSGSDVAASALTYIPEMVWNEDAQTGAVFSAGGGVSTFFAKPAWQIETGAPGMTTTVNADASRDVPDLALDAAALHDPLLLCYTYTLVPPSNPNYNPGCVAGFRQTSGGTLTVAGGTSFDSQIFGGMLALIEQKVGSRFGLVTPTLYALGNNAAYYSNTSASVFHDVTSGNNSNPCTSTTPNCPNGGTEGFSAATGYDLATGWGSVDLNNLANAWAWGMAHPTGAGASIGTNVSTTTLATTPACTAPITGGGVCSVSVTAGNSVTLTATVTGTGATPTGTVQFLDNNVALGTPVTLNGSGVATYPYSATCSNLGQQNLSVVYSGDTNYAGSKGPALLSARDGSTGGASISSNGTITTSPLILTVTSNTCPDFSLTPSGSGSSTATIAINSPNAGISVAANGTIPPITISVMPANGLTGTVSFTASVSSTTGLIPTVSFSPSSLTFSSSSSAAQSTSVSISGIIAGLKMPPTPGEAHPVGGAWYGAGSGVAIAGLMMILLPRRRRLGGLLLALMAISTIAGMSGCSSSSSTVNTSGSGSTVTNPDAGTYTVTVLATYSASGQTITHSSVLTYNIQ